jgi:hypothetical protein
MIKMSLPNETETVLVQFCVYFILASSIAGLRVLFSNIHSLLFFAPAMCTN